MVEYIYIMLFFLVCPFTVQQYTFEITLLIHYDFFNTQRNSNETGTEVFTTEGAKRTWQSKFTVNVMLFM